MAQVVVDDGIVDALKQQLAQMQEQLRMRELADLQIVQGVDGRNIPAIADIISQQKREIILERLRGVEHVLQVSVARLPCSYNITNDLTLITECCQIFR